MAHKKTIAQSRDRQGADPLADARGSVPTSIFGTAANKNSHVNVAVFVFSCIS
jgi:hypothetical protein